MSHSQWCRVVGNNGELLKTLELIGHDRQVAFYLANFLDVDAQAEVTVFEDDGSFRGLRGLLLPSQSCVVVSTSELFLSGDSGLLVVKFQPNPHLISGLAPYATQEMVFDVDQLYVAELRCVRRDLVFEFDEAMEETCVSLVRS